MTPDVLLPVSYFLNSFVFLAFGSMLCSIIGMNLLFPHRHSLVLCWVYAIAKAALGAVMDVMEVFHLGGVMVDVVWSLAALTSIVVFIVLYYTWEGPFFRIWIGALYNSIIALIALIMSLLAVNTLFGFGVSINRLQPFGVYTIAITCLMLALFMLFIRALRPVGRAITDQPIANEGALMVACYSLSVVASVTNIRMDGESEIYVAVVQALLFLLVGLALVGYLWRRQWRRSRQLARRRAVISSYEDAVCSQAAFLESSRDMLDGLAGRIMHVEAGNVRGELNVHLETLRETSNRLRFGTYSDNAMLDVALLSFEEKFRAMGYGVLYEVSPLASADVRVVLSALALLEWTSQLCVPGAGGDESAGPSDAPLSRSMEFRAFRKANQLMFEAKVPVSMGRRVSRRALAGRLPDGTRVVMVSRAGYVLTAGIAVGVNR